QQTAPAAAASAAHKAPQQVSTSYGGGYGGGKGGSSSAPGGGPVRPGPLAGHTPVTNYVATILPLDQAPEKMTTKPNDDGGGIDKGEEIKIIDPDGNQVYVKPFDLFVDTPFPAALVNSCLEAGFTKPSQIQGYAWPLALMGYDTVGIAATGSGKTIAFLFPAFMHIVHNCKGGRDPILLTLAPTRELAVQIEKEAGRFGQSLGVKSVCAYGGAPKGGQLAQMRSGCQVLIATPGRLNDFLE
ncbi:unnamed protein product, partial [Polarella glacialis]